jgi:hypothetical protein
VAFDLHLGKDMPDLSVPPDDVGGAHDSHGRVAVEIFFLPDPIGFKHFAGSIARQRKVQLVLVAELLQHFDGVTTGSQDDRVEFVQFFFGVTELVRLAGSTRGIGFGKEEKDDVLPFEITQTDFVAGVRRQ